MARVSLLLVVIAVTICAVKERVFFARNDLVVQSLRVEKGGEKLAPGAEGLGVNQGTYPLVGAQEALYIAKGEQMEDHEDHLAR